MEQVYYFTRTQTSHTIAKQVAIQLHADIYEIKDNQHWLGAFGYTKAGYYAMAKRTVPASYVQPMADKIYLCFPLWAGGFPPAVRTFINEVGRDKIIAVVSSKGSLLEDRSGFIQVIDVVGTTDIQLK